MKTISARPGINPSTLAAASKGISPANTLPARVMIPLIGLASTTVRPLANSASIQENMKQKKAVTAMPGAISGRSILRKKPIGCSRRGGHFRPLPSGCWI